MAGGKIGVKQPIGSEVSGMPPGDATREQVLAALERILASEEFVGSSQLSSFLRHVVENGLSGEGQSLKESVIGLTVFNRGPGYDPKADPIVRVEARRLRARLETYYSKHGVDEPVRILLPKGGYAPVFEPSELVPDVPKSKWHMHAISAILVLTAGILGGAIAVNRYANRPETLVSKFWSSILDGERPALLIAADSGLVLLQDMSHEAAQLSEYSSGQYRSQLAAQSGVNSDTALAVGGRRYTAVVDLEFACRLAQRHEAIRLGLRPRYSRDLRLEDLQKNNLVFLGARQSDPWITLFERNATFRLDHDERTGDYKVVNTRPGPGEEREILVTPAQAQCDIYGIITYHRNSEGTGRVLHLAGTSTAGTQAAADFLLDDARLLPWLRRACVRDEIPGFDILLHARNLSGTAPRADIVALHVDR
jgi:hypothetical protein